MIESIQRIHSRIGEIQSTFNKLGFAPLNTQLPVKPFSEYLNEAMASDSANKINNADGSLLIENNINNKTFDNGKIIDEDTFNGKISFGVYDDITNNLTNNFAKAINAYKKTSADFPNTYDSIINEASEKYSVPKDLIKAVIKQESNYMPNAISSKGAIGLMQIMPSTGALLGIEDKESLKDPYVNIMTGTKYLSQMLNRYDGRLDLSLSAYNAGPNLVDKLQRIPNIDETKNYVKNIIGYIK
ncbi:lytic transglycosylase domain-containing protein [Brachyspira catarrhinii]|uniref:Lytic transglycosylase domain-containing protein n=1 Tax=Brachyspira catarrhinii TaxID=2528966 RepID=A0ABY2TTC1_9SPIR|nr:lytic transglycosylase domain-containing protein [Brachyspira catarrhinii]TKZ36009.1 lytic transglycosylase domain-containing protein [Brachyspira catarrhinii]